MQLCAHAQNVVNNGPMASAAEAVVVVSLQTAHSWANAGVLLGDACIGSRVALEATKLSG